MADLTDLITSASDLLSLLLIIASFLVVSYLFVRVKTLRSFQFEMFVVLLVITLSEVPKILDSLGVINLADIETTGLEIHSIAMVFLSGFIAIRVARFLRKGEHEPERI